MLAENLRNLIEALVESEFRRALGGTKVFRKAVLGPDKAQQVGVPEEDPQAFQDPSTTTPGGRGYFNPNSHWTHPDKKAAIAKIQKR